MVTTGKELCLSSHLILCLRRSHLIGGVCKSLYIFSIHAPTPGRDEIKIPYEKKVQEMLDRIRDVAGSSDIVIGGDFNLGTAVRHPSEIYRQMYT